MNVKICKVCGMIGLDQMDFNMIYVKKNSRYYYRLMCKECSRKKLCTGKAGRPAGYVPSTASRNRTGKSKTGQQHTSETKDKISASLLKYFDDMYPLSDELLKEYKKFDVDGEISKFIADNKEALDSFDDVKSERRLGSKRYYEDEIKEWGPSCVIDTRTPELLLILKEEIEEKK